MTTPETQFQTRDVADPDWDAIADLISQYEPYGVTGDMLRQRQAPWNDNDPRLRKVVTDASGSIVAYCRCMHRASDPRGIFRFNVYVDPSFTGRGIGLSLLVLAEGFGKDNQATSMMTSAEEWCQRGRDFAAKAGYEVAQHLFESRLDLTAFDPGPYIMAQALLEDEGYRFLNLEDLGDTDDSWQKLYALDTVTDRDTPGSEYWTLGTLEEYIASKKNAATYMAQGVNVATYNDQWIGVNIVIDSTHEGEMHTDYTGVLKEFRGKGIAQVLKVLGIQLAISLGKQTLVTNNDDRNAPMLAINKKLGFVEKPGFYIYKKSI